MILLTAFAQELHGLQRHKFRYCSSMLVWERIISSSRGRNMVIAAAVKR